MGLLNHLIFDDISSMTYGFFINGQATYDAPARRGETVTVPGRNGTLFLDEDTFDNIEVEYEAFMAADSDDEFQQRIRDFRSALLSKRGYLRLTDTYHPEEFRLAMYKSGLEIDPVMYNRAGKFTLKFDCKPQRYLKTGEEPLEDPHTGIWYINNPTLFPAKPLIEVHGYGQLWLNGYCLTVQNLEVGIIDLVPYAREQTNYEGGETASSLIASFIRHDYMNWNDAHLDAKWWIAFTVGGAKAGTITLTEQSVSDTDVISTTRNVNGDGLITIGLACNSDTFFMGQTRTANYSAVIRVNYTNTSDVAKQVDVTVSVSATLGLDNIELSSVSVTASGVTLTKVRETRQINSFKVRSTERALGDPLYVDMESGDAYKIEDGETIYVNNLIWVGETLPVLEPGRTMVVPDGETGMTVRIIPRWWTL